MRLIDIGTQNAKKNPDNKRIPAIDAVRTMAIFAVIVIHSDPLTGASYSTGSFSLGDLLDFACRFAVPFFLIAAGYFYGRRFESRRERPAVIRSFCLRVLSLVSGWYIFYIIWPTNWTKGLDQGLIRSAYWNAIGLFSDFSNFMVGPRQHLWFLSALLFAMLHVVLASLAVNRRAMCFYFSLLYLFGLSQGPYRYIIAPELSLPPVPGWLLLPPLIFAIGWLVAQTRFQAKPCIAWGLFIVGTFITFLEAFWLHSSHDIGFSNHDFLIGTPLQAVGILFLAIIYPDWAKGTPLPGWGGYTMGVYAAHVAVIELFHIRTEGCLIWELLKAPFVYGVTLVLVIWLARFGKLRRFLT